MAKLRWMYPYACIRLACIKIHGNPLSDSHVRFHPLEAVRRERQNGRVALGDRSDQRRGLRPDVLRVEACGYHFRGTDRAAAIVHRSDERRIGKECVSTMIYRRS